ncbi:hypothetical protein Tco_0214178 [Tanacetum coccineum]
MASNEETNAAGTDTRPPMLVESDYDSWKIRIHRYIRGKPNGKQIWKSIQNGPTPHPMITDPPPTDSAAVPAPREKLDSEFSEEENKLEMADTQAEIILSQGRKLFKKEGRSVDDINAFVILETNQFMTTRNMDISTTPYVQIYTHLKAYEPHAKKTLRNRQSTIIVDHWPIGEGHVARQCKEPKRKMGLSANFKYKALLMEKLREEDMCRLLKLKHSSLMVHSNDNQLFDNMDYQIQEMHQEEHLDSDAETEIDDNTIPYHQYLLDRENER